jgi:hypothetical protein
MNEKKSIILASTLFLVIACNNQSDNNKKSEVLTQEEDKIITKIDDKSSGKAVIVNKVNLKNEKLNANKLQLKNETKKSLLINGEKLIVHSSELKKGTKVYSASIRQVGIVKGSIVVVTKKLDANQLTSKYKISSITKLAVNTFQLVPDDSENLYQFYRTLQGSELIDQVELAIDYSEYFPKAETKTQ